MTVSELPLEFTSGAPGSNATVVIHEDRIEWGRTMIPVGQIRAVTTHRESTRLSVVRVVTSADIVEFRVSGTQAEQIKTTITRLMLALLPARPGSALAADSPVPAPRRPPAGQALREPAVRDAIAAAKRRRVDPADD
jgi:hypothetical protein